RESRVGEQRRRPAEHRGKWDRIRVGRVIGGGAAAETLGGDGEHAVVAGLTATAVGDQPGGTEPSTCHREAPGSSTATALSPASAMSAREVPSYATASGAEPVASPSAPWRVTLTAGASVPSAFTPTTETWSLLASATMTSRPSGLTASPVGWPPTVAGGPWVQLLAPSESAVMSWPVPSAVMYARGWPVAGLVAVATA